jgi:hypothetical protein
LAASKAEDGGRATATTQHKTMLMKLIADRILQQQWLMTKMVDDGKTT